MQVTKRHIVEVLRMAGLSQVAEEANRSLPDEMTMEHAEQFVGRYGITKDQLISRMGGSP
jgi:hypothetical protein